MSLFTDLEKDILAASDDGQVQGSQIFELLCNLIDLKFEKLNSKQKQLEKQIEKKYFDLKTIQYKHLPEN